MLEEIEKLFIFTPEERKQDAILKKKDNVFYLFLNRKANSFTHDFIRLIHKKLDEVQKSQGAATLVTVSMSKMYSGGLDLRYATNLPHPSQKYFVLEFIALLGRMSVFTIPTIALVKGAAIAGGCMFSFAHDNIYVADKALFACNQVDIGLYLPPGMFSVIKKKHNDYRSLRDMCLFGKKFSAQQALSYGMIDGIIDTKKIMEQVHKKAQQLSNYGSNRENFKKIKQQAHKQVIDCCFNKQHAWGAVGEITFPQLPKL